MAKQQQGRGQVRLEAVPDFANVVDWCMCGAPWTPDNISSVVKQVGPRTLKCMCGRSWGGYRGLYSPLQTETA